MGEGIDIYGYRWRGAQTKRTKSQIYRDFYKPKLDKLLTKTYEKAVPGGSITVGFSKKGNKHLYDDAFKGNGGLQKIDLINLHKRLKAAEYVSDAGLYKQRKDNIKHFYYFKTRLHGKIVYLNVAKEEYRQRNGRVRSRHYLYSIRSKIR